MIRSASLDAYRSHELSIQMKTSSGDTLSLDFENTQALSMRQQEKDGSKASSFSFSSMQAFSFRFESNGISEQDRAEIEAFMEKAQPYIDRFMKELEEQNPTSPINKIASSVTQMIGDLKNRDDNTKNFAKNKTVELFDKGAEKVNLTEKMIEEAQKLLQKVLDGFEKTFEPLYA